MEAKKIEGKQVKAANVRKLIGTITRALKGETVVPGSLDQDQYGARMSFVLDGMVIGLSYSQLGGAIC